MKRALSKMLMVISLIILSLGSAFALDVPPLTGRVVDEAKVLTEAQKAELTGILRAIEEKSGAQVVVLTVESLQGDDPFEFTQRAFEKYKLGRKDKNDGFLFMVAKAERKFRLHPGYGLEGAIPDAECKRIGTEVMAPFMKGKRGGEDDYFSALKAGIERVSKLIDGEVKAEDRPPVGKSKSGEHDGKVIAFGVLLVLAAIVTFVTDSMVAGGLIGAVGSPLVTVFAIGMNPVHLIAAAVIGFLVGCMAWLIVQLGINVLGGGGVFSGGGGSSGGGGATSDF